MKKLGFGLMRLPVLEDKPANINMEVLKEMVDVFLNRGFTYFDTAYMYPVSYTHLDVYKRQGCECKRGDTFSWAVLIGRGLDQSRIIFHLYFFSAFFHSIVQSSGLSLIHI